MKYLDHPSPLGTMRIAASELGICSIRFPQHAHFSDEQMQAWQHAPHDALLLRTAQQLDEYFHGERQVFDVPLDLHGTAFQQKVWRALQTIPYGKTSNYGELAKQIGQANAARPLGAANGRNPISIIVPCHRVIGANGALVGYAGGLERKQALLALEAGKTQAQLFA